MKHSLTTSLAICVALAITNFSPIQQESKQIPVFYMPFNVDTYLPIDEESIEKRFNISSLVSSSLNRIALVLESADAPSKLYKDAIRLKFSYNNHHYLVDREYNVSVDGQVHHLSERQREDLFILFVELIPRVTTP